MRSCLVLDPGCAFQDLARRFVEAGWHLADSAARPILPKERSKPLEASSAFDPSLLIDCWMLRMPCSMPSVSAPILTVMAFPSMGSGDFQAGVFCGDF